MFGTVIVQAPAAAAAPSHPGTLGFSLANYAVNEGAGSATIAVQRLGGADGAVSVHYAATAGSATAGQDFTAAPAPSPGPTRTTPTRRSPCR